MYPSRLAIPTLVATLAGCEGDPETAASPLPEPAASELFLAAVDAGNGAPLSDGELTVRYLVRAPITLDATAVERVPSAEPYRIVHAVAADSLVVEVRLEAPSYARIDTVLSVPRGGSAGPFRIAMAPRTERPAGGRAAGAAAARPGPRPTAPSPERRPTAAAADELADANIDRTGLRDGDVAFDRGDWRAAVAGYRRMATPRGSGPYASEYQLALVRLGISQINLGQWPGAYEALTEAVALDDRQYTGYFYLGQVECALGRFEAGRRTLGQVDNLASTISEAQRPIVLAVADYQRAVCSHDEFQQACTAAEAQQTAARALAELETFIARGEAMTPVPAPVQQAVTDARRRMREIAGR